MTFLQALVLFVAAVLGGMLNSVAGGGSFIAFPALIVTGVPPINANATNTVALWPGSVASARAFAKSLHVPRTMIVTLVATSLVGGVIGAIVLLHTPQKTFLRLVPWLLLLATLLFTFGPAITAWMRAHMGQRRGPEWLSVVGTVGLQLPIAIYGGFFGGGIGILMLSMLSVMGLENMHTMNALKNLLASSINGVAVVTFIIAGAVVWPQAIVMIVGAIAGGYGTATFVQRLDPKLVRRFVMLVGFAMTIYFFVRG
jgi:uncharacterized protein